MKSQCPESGILQAYADGELTLDEKLKVEEHLDLCPFCTRMVTNIISEDNWLTGLFGIENQLLIEESNTVGEPLFGDIGVKWSWVTIIFFLLGFTLLLAGGSWLKETNLGYWLLKEGPGLLFASVIQQVVVHVWQLIITAVLQWFSSQGTLWSGILHIALNGIVIGLVAITILSRKLVKFEEAIE
ncbi:MAG: hypothetical protein H6Q64_414 [Firmicutes bacterium]|nr:hypothetical protein [Bacillota bacterium]